MERHENPKYVRFFSARWGRDMAATVMRTGYREGPEKEEGVSLTFTKTDDEEMWDGQAWRLEVAGSFGED